MKLQSRILARRRRLHPGAVGLALCALLLFAAPTLAPADAPPPPVNDNYLDSLNLNQPGTPLNRTKTYKSLQDTTNATVQSDIFGPNDHGGGAEQTTCRGASYGKTVWYDFYPDADGVMEIRTSGFDNVIAVYPYSNKTLKPDVAQRNCAHSSSFPTETLVMPVKKGGDYTVQIGGVDNAGGQLQVLFDYVVTPPHRVSAQATLKAVGTATGIKLLGLTVATARTAKVTVNCGSYCRTQSRSGHATESFPGLGNVQMPARSKLRIYVTAPKSIGAYIEYDVGRANFNKITRCLEPGSKTPRKSCQ